MKLKFKTLLECLVYMRDVEINKYKGICGNVCQIAHMYYWCDIDDQLDRLIDEWISIKDDPMLCHAYPVGGCAEYSDGYVSHTLWSNPKRRELLHWLIFKLENQ